jgi:hypothetical protein
MMAQSPLLAAQMDFRPVPVADRESPGRIKSVPARLYIDKWVEHRQAYDFIQQQQDLHGDGSRTLVRALVYYRDTVIIPLAARRERQASGKRASTVIPPELLVAQLAFVPVPPEQRQDPGRIKHISARLYIDKYLEHREAYEALQAEQELHGEGLKTLVRALLHYRDNVIYRPPPPSMGKVDDSNAVQLKMNVE